jgi:hypothetical protein
MKTIRINAIQFAEMCGKEIFRLIRCDEFEFTLGEEICCEVWSNENPHPTGARLKRYIVDWELLSTSRNEDLFYVLILSSLAPSEMMPIKTVLS